MTTALEAFFTQPTEDEPEALTGDPLESIAASLAKIASELAGQTAAYAAALEEDLPALDGTAVDPTASLEAEVEDLKGEAAFLAGLLDEVSDVVKPSSSKVSLSVKEVLNKRWGRTDAEKGAQSHEAQPEGVYVTPSAEAEITVHGSVVPVENAAEMGLPQPADDAPIEAWVTYARALGLDIDPGRTNRSQIRTALGIAHPAAADGETA